MRFRVLVMTSLLAPLAVSLPPVLVPSAARELSFVGLPEQVLQLRPGQTFSALVHLKIFGPLQAGVTIEDAERRMGPPKQLFRGEDYPEWRYARYELPQSLVDVAYEPRSSSCATYHRRTLYAYPKSGSWGVGDVLNSDLAKSLRLTANVTRLLVISSDDQDRVWCLVRGGKVEVVNWHHAAK